MAGTAARSRISWATRLATGSRLGGPSAAGGHAPKRPPARVTARCRAASDSTACAGSVPWSRPVPQPGGSWSGTGRRSVPMSPAVTTSSHTAIAQAALATTAVLNGSVASVPSRLSGRKPRTVHSPKTSIGSPAERASSGQGSSGRSMMSQHSPSSARSRHGPGPGTGTALITAGIRTAQGSDATSWAKRARTSPKDSAGGIVGPAVALVCSPT